MAIVLFSFSSCSKDSVEEMEMAELTSKAPAVSYSDYELQVMELVNAYRVEKGLSKLENLDEISYQAETHNIHMIKNDEVCHDQFGSRYSALVKQVEAEAVSENVAYGHRTAEAVVQAWIKSDSHRKNMEGNHTHFGISVTKDDKGKFYITNIFIRQ
ncbi:MAG TPA: CAP domain-containing protein [Salinimicrobium sp.]|nr:CAP domain-containing protein [Salinimicrobium sp.]